MLPHTIDPGAVRFRETIGSGGMWSHVMKRHTSLRIIDSTGGINVSALFYNAHNTSERYNMPDTLKAQHIARLCYPYVLYSDMGRILCSITSDSVGWHDTITGVSDRALIESKYGKRDYQDCRNNFFRNGEDNFLIELGKYGLGPLDLVANVNFFSKVSVTDVELGELKYETGHSRVGDHIDLRFEMDVLAIMTTAPHPMDSRNEYHAGTAELVVYDSAPPDSQDPSRTVRPENARGFENTERYYL